MRRGGRVGARLSDCRRGRALRLRSAQAPRDDGAAKGLWRAGRSGGVLGAGLRRRRTREPSGRTWDTPSTPARACPHGGEGSPRAAPTWRFRVTEGATSTAPPADFQEGVKVWSRASFPHRAGRGRTHPALSCRIPPPRPQTPSRPLATAPPRRTRAPPSSTSRAGWRRCSRFLYVAWADGLLTPSEIAAVRDRIAGLAWLDDDDRAQLAAWLDPAAPPDATTYFGWIRTMRRAAHHFDADGDGLADLGADLAALAGRGNGGGLAPEARRALEDLEAEIGVVGEEVVRDLLEAPARDERRVEPPRAPGGSAPGRPRRAARRAPRSRPPAPLRPGLRLPRAVDLERRLPRPHPPLDEAARRPGRRRARLPRVGGRGGRHWPVRGGLRERSRRTTSASSSSSGSSTGSGAGPSSSSATRPSGRELLPAIGRGRPARRIRHVGARPRLERPRPPDDGDLRPRDGRLGD